MESVVFARKAESKLEMLVYTLYKKEYFGFMDSAIQYVRNLRAFANGIPEEKKRKCKNPRYGTWYCRYKHNQKTTWYFTFDTDGNTYIIRNVLNNHSRDYPAFIESAI